MSSTTNPCLPTGSNTEPPCAQPTTPVTTHELPKVADRDCVGCAGVPARKEQYAQEIPLPFGDDPVLQDILCREFGICGSTSVTTPISTSNTNPKTTSTSTQCPDMNAVALSWIKAQEPNCVKWQYDILTDVDIIEATLPKHFEINFHNTDSADTVYQYSSDGGKTWMTVTFNGPNLFGRTDAGWLKDRFEVLIMATTLKGKDLYQVSLNSDTGVGTVQPLGSIRYPTSAQCVNDKWVLAVVGAGVTLQSMTLTTTGDLTVTALSNDSVRIRGLYGEVTGTVILTCQGQSVVRPVPRMYAGGNGTLVADPCSLTDTAAIVFRQTEVEEEVLATLAVKPGIIRGAVGWNVAGALVIASLGDTVKRLRLTGTSVTVNVSIAGRCSAIVAQATYNKPAPTTSVTQNCPPLSIVSTAVEPDGRLQCLPLAISDIVRTAGCGEQQADILTVINTPITTYVPVTTTSGTTSTTQPTTTVQTTSSQPTTSVAPTTSAPTTTTGALTYAIELQVRGLGAGESSAPILFIPTEGRVVNDISLPDFINFVAKITVNGQAPIAGQYDYVNIWVNTPTTQHGDRTPDDWTAAPQRYINTIWYETGHTTEYGQYTMNAEIIKDGQIVATKSVNFTTVFTELQVIGAWRQYDRALETGSSLDGLIVWAKLNRPGEIIQIAMQDDDGAKGGFVDMTSIQIDPQGAQGRYQRRMVAPPNTITVYLRPKNNPSREVKFNTSALHATRSQMTLTTV